MLTFFERLDYFMKYKGLNDNKLTVETGISNGIIGKARKRGKLSQENISKILHTYPELNANWLFTNTGNMLNKNDRSTIQNNSELESEVKLRLFDSLFNLNNHEVLNKLDLILNQNKQILDRLDRTLVKEFIQEEKQKLKSSHKNTNQS